MTAAAACLGTGPAAAQTTTRCLGAASGTTCEMWTGKVTFIGDGDTMSVDVDGDGTKTPKHIRISGINATEETYYTNVPEDRTGGECHANEAAAELERLVKRSKGRVRLYAQNPDSTSRGRWKRSVGVKINGTWRDVGRQMIKEGQALWMAGGREWGWNRSYSELAQRADHALVGIYDPDYCAPGPEPAAKLRMWVNSDAPGYDRRNPNGEWVKIKNLDPVNQVFIGGWRVRDSGLRGYVFPLWTYIPPGATITVHVGSGTDGETPSDFYWGLKHGVFDNVNSELGIGDGAYLFDPDGDLRLSMIYPCRDACTDPYQGALDIRAYPRRSNEYVTVQNTSQAPVDLEGYRLASSPYTYDFAPGSVLQPGEQIRVDVKGDPADDTQFQRGWGLSHTILGNTSDKVSVQTFNYIDVACTAWGSASC